MRNRKNQSFYVPSFEFEVDGNLGVKAGSMLFMTAADCYKKFVNGGIAVDYSTVKEAGTLNAEDDDVPF